MLTSGSHLGHIACLPPSTGMVAPVTKEALSEARNAITDATSSTLPARPKACVDWHFTRN